MRSLRELVGVELGPSAWFEVTQERIDAFGACERAAAGPFGTTIAHGFLTLSLCVPMLYELLPPVDRMVVNYGVNRVRFPARVPSGSRIRGRFRIVDVEGAAGGERAAIEATVECDAGAKPVCVAELVVLTLP